MAQSYNAVANPGAFVPTTNIINPSMFQDVEINSAEFKQLMVTLAQFANDIALTTNIRDAGYYPEVEFINGQLWYPNPANSSTTGTLPAYAQYRQVYRKVIDFGELPNNTSKAVNHDIDITSTFTFTRIYATASDTSGMTYIPIPYVSLSSDSIELSVSSTQVIITTEADRTAYATTYVILEYIKN